MMSQKSHVKGQPRENCTDIELYFSSANRSKRGTGARLTSGFQLARQMYHRLAGLHRAAFWREQGFPNLVRARAAWARICAERRRQKAAKQFSQFAISGEHYEDMLPPPKPPQRRRKQVYKSRVLGRTGNIVEPARRIRYRPGPGSRE
jgi:hypothetical protein